MCLSQSCIVVLLRVVWTNVIYAVIIFHFCILDFSPHAKSSLKWHYFALVAAGLGKCSKQKLKTNICTFRQVITQMGIFQTGLCIMTCTKIVQGAHMDGCLEWICPICTKDDKFECDVKWDHILKYIQPCRTISG